MAPYPENPGPLPSGDLADEPLKMGDSGDEVKKLQKMLEFLEYSCGPRGPDGTFGDYTKKAVQKFQGEHTDYEGKSLSQDGKVGKHTSDALNRCMVGKWYGKWLTPREFTRKFLLLTITEEDLKQGADLEPTEEIKKARVVVAPVHEEVTLGIGLTPTPEDWLPDARNGRIRFKARIYARKGEDWIYPGRKRRIIFRLTSSKEKGICMNFPLYGNTNPDLFFAEDRNQAFEMDDDKTEGTPCPTTIITAGDNPAHRHHYQKMTSLDMVTEATAEVRCEDYGAYGFLEAFIDDGKELPAPAEGDPVAWDEDEVSEKKVKVKIPWDKNENDIADSAEQDDEGAAGDSDDDEDPDGDGDGDGLTNYEEYRGFIVKEGKKVKHIRTDITTKDIFIHNPDNLPLGYFEETTLSIHLLQGPDSYFGDSSNGTLKPPDPNTQVINFNRGHLSKGEQHGLRLVNEVMDQTYGWAQGVGPGTPKTSNRVAINRKLCLGAGEPEGQLEATVSHELGHAINMQHHGANQSHDCDGKE
ncbi:MAG: peptidoglycan-binding protein, partial [Methanomicrobiales archaeon]|nr:peptidoglycan-binding protein [Methanomicrobiales archaeon]